MALNFRCMGYWPSVRSRWLDIGQVLFLRVYGPRRSRGPYTRKKRTRPISSHLDQTNLVNKGFIIWLLVKFCLRDTAGSPERARWLHLASSGSQSQRSIWFILPAHGASHIINQIIILAYLVCKTMSCDESSLKHNKQTSSSEVRTKIVFFMHQSSTLFA